MIVHGNLELLSGFVDEELEAPEREAVRSHLADCPPCRERIGGLRRVVAELRALEGTAPPPGLSRRVRRAVTLDRDRAGALERGAGSLLGWTGQPLLLPLFGVVTALAVVLYLFTAWSGRVEHPGTRLIVGPPAAAVDTAREGDTVRFGERTFRRTQGRWVESGVDPAEVAEVVDLRLPDPSRPALEAFRRLGGRVVLRHGGRPIEVLFDAPAAGRSGD